MTKPGQGEYDLNTTDQGKLNSWRKRLNAFLPSSTGQKQLFDLRDSSAGTRGRLHWDGHNPSAGGNERLQFRESRPLGTGKKGGSGWCSSKKLSTPQIGKKKKPRREFKLPPFKQLKAGSKEKTGNAFSAPKGRMDREGKNT